MSSLNLRSVSSEPLPEYPISSAVRLDSHGFMAWEFRRYLNSDLRWNASHEVKGLWFELVQLAHEQTPVGTLPADRTRLARMVVPAVDPLAFASLADRPFGILHGWHECECDDGSIRLMHPTVTRVVLEALTRKELNGARTDGASRSRRLNRLGVTLGALAPTIASEAAQIYFVDAHIQNAMELEGNKRRSDAQLHDAIQACLVKASAGHFRKSKKD
ncbi:hypothetical protein GGR95_002948 [Sulfitobacter undariae]|uniref:Uncharacterized protein n=1 Tax=Sulfitobacter undariae TaxID=1563671 RepID=A0A7W6EBS5_9RHOB|nr:hypothetical protein [Sulfitobacter undariae]